MTGEALSKEVPSARADGARRRTPGRRQSGTPAACAPVPRAPRRSWFARVVRLATIALVLLGLAGIGVAASAPGSAASPRALLSAVLEAGAGGAPQPAPPAPSPGTRSVGWLAPPRGTGPAREAAPAGVASSSPAAEATATPPPSPSPSPRPCVPLAEPTPTSAASAGAAPAGSARAPGSALVVLNRADASELMRLPGIGRRRAEAIIALRERLGGFERPSDLLRVRGIGTRSLERMLPLMIVDEPAPPAP